MHTSACSKHRLIMYMCMMRQPRVQMERRDRLKKIIAEQEVQGLEGAPVTGQLVLEEQVVVQKEVFYTEGAQELQQGEAHEVVHLYTFVCVRACTCALCVDTCDLACARVCACASAFACMSLPACVHAHVCRRVHVHKRTQPSERFNSQTCILFLFGGSA